MTKEKRYKYPDLLIIYQFSIEHVTFVARPSTCGISSDLKYIPHLTLLHIFIYLTIENFIELVSISIINLHLRKIAKYI